MNDIIQHQLKKYQCKSVHEYERALKEIIQEIALLGLWRSKFFEKACFYGGTALRILYQLPRFSEDIDFTLIKRNDQFSLSIYENALIAELESYGFKATIETKVKKINSDIDSAFIKANTLYHLIQIDPQLKTHKDAILNIKIEVDKNPPSGAGSEVIQHFFPIPFSIKTYELSSLFAGKISAILCRKRLFNIKGRDWFDFLWYISRDTPINIFHLQKRMEQFGNWNPNKKLKLQDVQKLLENKINSLELKSLINDVLPFIQKKSDIEAWDRDLFKAAIGRLRV